MPLITVSATVINDGLMVIFYASMALVFVFTSATLNTYEQIFTVMILAFVSPVGRSDWEGFLERRNPQEFSIPNCHLFILVK